MQGTSFVNWTHISQWRSFDQLCLTDTSQRSLSFQYLKLTYLIAKNPNKNYQSDKWPGFVESLNGFCMRDECTVGVVHLKMGV